jgi:type IV pilus assembly protein PilA
LFVFRNAIWESVLNGGGIAFASEYLRIAECRSEALSYPENPMKQIQKGFTLIELMIVVAIVGILAAIALPAYQDYVVRSKMSETEAALAACKTSVSEYLSTKSSLPADVTAAGCSTQVTKYVASLDVATGVITGVSQNTGAGTECTLSLTPTTSGATITTWTGTFSACAAKYVPSAFR